MYKNNDIIFAMGAPGSRWSSIIRTIQSSNTCFNVSDESPKMTFKNEKTKRGWHAGSYFGPDQEYGHGFDNIKENYTFDQFLEECKKPYRDFNTGIKIVKSHWFSYNIDTLREWFPNCKLLAVHQSDEKCFKHWHTVGGWDIPYPHYYWYKDDETMKNQIAIENSNIVNNFDLKYYKINKLLDALEIDQTNNRTVKEMIDFDNNWQYMLESVNNEYTDNPKELLNFILGTNDKYNKSKNVTVGVA